jgi:hypothetical protein
MGEGMRENNGGVNNKIQCKALCVQIPSVPTMLPSCFPSLAFNKPHFYPHVLPWILPR